MSATPRDCDSDSDAIPAREALRRIQSRIKPLADTECVELRHALSRVTAAKVVSEVQVPNHTNAAMDGYALCAGDANNRAGGALRICGAAFAGKPLAHAVGGGECAAIMTGAVLPQGCDTVVAKERVQVSKDAVKLSQAVKAGDNVRLAGEDLQVGDVAIPAGQRLDAAHLGLAASLGVAELRVRRRPRVAFFSNGDELREVGAKLQLGELYDSNRYTLRAMLAQLNADVIDMGVIADDARAIRDALTTSARDADMVLTSAGASVGDADYVAQAFADMGEVFFSKVAIKPGRPLAFGKLAGGAWFFGLPGNPVSVMVTFDVFVRPALRQLAGEEAAFNARLEVSATCLQPLRKRAGRMEYQRGVLQIDSDGEITVQTTGEQGSGVLHSMARANCYIVLPPECDGVAAGERVWVRPFAPG